MAEIQTSHDALHYKVGEQHQPIDFALQSLGRHSAVKKLDTFGSSILAALKALMIASRVCAELQSVLSSSRVKTFWPGISTSANSSTAIR